MKWTPPQISLVWLGTLAFLAIEILLGWTFVFRWYDRESIKFFATVTGGAFALFVFLKRIEEIRFQVSDKLIERWNKPDLKPILERSRPVVEGVLKSRAYARPIYFAPNAKPEETALRGDILYVLGFFEEIAIAVHSKSADEDRLKRFFGAVIPAGYDGFQGFVLAERLQDKDHEYYREVQTLVERWTKRKRPEAEA